MSRPYAASVYSTLDVNPILPKKFTHSRLVEVFKIPLHEKTNLRYGVIWLLSPERK